jgi:ATP-dependent DNA helicase RecQ
LISPERLNNPAFARDILPGLLDRIGLLVVDEVHCISDWGHDFRPDYRRLARIVQSLPPNTPVLGTTATANNRVIADVVDQFGADLTVERGGLDRESLALQVINLPDVADRLAWLLHVVPDLEGSGIVYCLTIRDAELVGGWLADHGVAARVYTGKSQPEDRLVIEEELSRGEVKAVIATSALGMGYDNRHIQFVIHFQSPGSPIFYYQQVGRAGRAVDHAYGILLTGTEDREIQDFFIDTAFPTEAETNAILSALTTGPKKLNELEGVVNIQRSRIAAFLKILEVEGAVYREDSTWHRSAQRWTYPTARVEAITLARRDEQQAMIEYATTRACLMQFLRNQLDDREALACGRCANCLGHPLLPAAPPEDLRLEAVRHLKRTWLEVPPRLQWPAETGLPSLKENANQAGRTLCRWGDPGWGRMVGQDKYQTGQVRDELINAAAEMINEWNPEPRPEWVTCIPDRAEHHFVADFAARLADRLGLPFVPAVVRRAERARQQSMNNSYQQVRNLIGVFEVVNPKPEPVFLVDDMVDSRWTFTMVGFQLRSTGVTAVYPVALADTSRSDQ